MEYDLKTGFFESVSGNLRITRSRWRNCVGREFGLLNVVCMFRGDSGNHLLLSLTYCVKVANVALDGTESTARSVSLH